MTSNQAPIENKHLSACIDCKLILNDAQWRDHYDFRCPNCITKTECTNKFSGMIAIMQPTDSWVARYNANHSKMPGVYAIRVVTEAEFVKSSLIDEDEE